MKIYNNYSNSKCSIGLAKLLVDLLAFKNHDVWLISPCLAEFRLPVPPGDFRSLLGGQKDEIRFTDLLTRVAQEHNLFIVTKPPGELIQFSKIKQLEEKLELRIDLENKKEEEEEEDLGLNGYTIVDDVIEELNRDIDSLANAALVHSDTIWIGRKLQAKGAKLYYRDQLQSKLLCTSIGALIGSANFTNADLTLNDELMLKITTPEELLQLQNAAKEMVDRAIDEQNYSWKQALEESGYKINDYKKFFNSPGLKDYPDFQKKLEKIIPFCRLS